MQLLCPLLGWHFWGGQAAASMCSAARSAPRKHSIWLCYLPIPVLAVSGMLTTSTNRNRSWEGWSALPRPNSFPLPHGSIPNPQPSPGQQWSIGDPQPLTALAHTPGFSKPLPPSLRNYPQQQMLKACTLQIQGKNGWAGCLCQLCQGLFASTLISSQ